MKFLDEKTDWIEKHLAKLRQSGANDIIEMPYSTRLHALKLRPDDRSNIKTSVKNGDILVLYPLEKHYSDQDVQEKIKAAIEVAWKIEAEEILPTKLSQTADKYGFKYGKLTINNTRSKWGSCSSRNDIQLSIHLMRLPDELIEYVILHELCHIIHKNHGEKFHTLLSRLTDGKHPELRKSLKNFHTRW